MAKATPAEVAHLAALIQARRPDWTDQGIRNALDRMLDEHDLTTVVAAAIRGADDKVIRTPAALPMPGPHWVNLTDTVATNSTNDNTCHHPPGECEHGAPHGHCALCRYPNGMPLEKRVSGPGREILRQGYAAKAEGNVGTRPATAHVQHELTE